MTCLLLKQLYKASMVVLKWPFSVFKRNSELCSQEMGDFSSGESVGHFRLATFHAEMNSRRRNTMEDCHRILPVINEALPAYSYFGVYDGHGGRQIVDFLENSLESSIIKELSLADHASILERLTRAYIITDMQSRDLKITTSGATAVSVLLYNNPATSEKRLYVANVGDSRAVLVSSKPAKFFTPDSTNSGDNAPAEQAQVSIESDEYGSESIKPSGYYATRLSYDHRAEDKAEQERIVAGGGFITRNRVLGILAVSRSFGDHGLKDFVIATPYVSETDLTTIGDCPMLIIACDGVWDVFTDQEAADLLMEKYMIAGPYANAAELLVHAAIERGSADNITAIVVFL